MKFEINDRICLTTELIGRVDRFGPRFHAARVGALAALPGNPFGVEIVPLMMGVACKVRHRLLRGKNRTIGFTPEDIDRLDEVLEFYQTDGLGFSLAVAHGRMTPELFGRLVSAGLWTTGSGTIPALIPAAGSKDAIAVGQSSGIVIRRSEIDEKDWYLDLFQRAFVHRADESDLEYRLFQWAEDSLPGSARYIAEIDGEAVGMASFPIIDGIGFCGTCGVVPEFRNRGVQSALIARRIADARDLGCDLVLGGDSPGSTSYRNFERAGFRLVPTGSGWTELPI